MSSELTFTPQGPTHLIESSATPALGVQVGPFAASINSKADSYRIYNSGSEAVFLGVDDTAAGAQAKAVAPTAGNPQECIAIAAGAVEILSFNKDFFFSAYSVGAVDVFINAGEGL